MGVIYSEPVKYTVATQTPLTPNQLLFCRNIPSEVVREKSGMTQPNNTQTVKGCCCMKNNSISPNESCLSLVENAFTKDDDSIQPCGCKSTTLYMDQQRNLSKFSNNRKGRDSLFKAELQRKESCSLGNPSELVENVQKLGKDICSCSSKTNDNTSTKLNDIGKTIKEREVLNYEEENRNLCKPSSTRKSVSQPVFLERTCNERGISQITDSPRVSKQGEGRSNVEKDWNSCACSNKEISISKNRNSLEAGAKNNRSSIVNECSKMTKQGESISYKEDNKNLQTPLSTRTSFRQPEYEEFQELPLRGKRSAQLHDNSKATKQQDEPVNLEHEQNSCKCSNEETSNSKYRNSVKVGAENNRLSIVNDCSKTTKHGESIPYKEDNKNLQTPLSTRTSFRQPEYEEFQELPLRGKRSSQLHDNSKATKQQDEPANLEHEQNSCARSNKEITISKNKNSLGAGAENNIFCIVNECSKTTKHGESIPNKEDYKNLQAPQSTRTSFGQPECEVFQQLPLRGKRSSQLYDNSRATKQQYEPVNFEQQYEPVNFEEICRAPPSLEKKNSKVWDSSDTTVQGELLSNLDDDKNPCSCSSKRNMSVINREEVPKADNFSKKIRTRRSKSQPEFTQKIPKGKRNTEFVGNYKITKQAELPPNLEQEEDFCGFLSKQQEEFSQLSPTKRKSKQLPDNKQEEPRSTGNSCSCSSKRYPVSQDTLSEVSTEDNNRIFEVNDDCKITQEKGLSYEEQAENLHREIAIRYSISQKLPQLPPTAQKNSKLMDNCERKKFEEVYSNSESDVSSFCCIPTGNSVPLRNKLSEEAVNNKTSSNLNNNCEIPKYQKIPQYIEENSNLCGPYIQNTISEEKLAQNLIQNNRMSKRLENFSTKNLEAEKLDREITSNIPSQVCNSTVPENKENLPKVDQDVTFCDCPFKRGSETSSSSEREENSTEETSDTTVCSLEINEADVPEKINIEKINPVKIRKDLNETEIMNSQLKKDNCSIFGTIKQIIVSNNFEVECLNEHNNLRALHNCPPLELNAKLTQLAKFWATNISRSKIIRRDDKNKYGENMYISVNMNINGTIPVQSWYKEISKYDFNNPSFHPNTGHFTQVIWKETKEIGVGVFTKDKSTWVVVYYNPPGNLIKKFLCNVPPLAKEKE